ncbi:MAG: MATE family efflux transporter [bacterium]
MRSPVRLTEGPITPALLRLAGPVLVSRALHTLYGVADTFWVGRLGPEAIAAVSTSTFALWTLYSIGDVLIGGVTALVSQAVGARRDEDAAATARAGFALALGLGAVVAALGWFGARPLFGALLNDPEVVEYGSDFLSLVSLLAPCFYVCFVAETVFRSCGDSRTPMLVMLAGVALNIALDPFLVLGLGPFPHLGVRGAAIATMIAETLVISAYAVLWLRGRFPLSLARHRRGALAARADVLAILRVGAPFAATGILFSVVYLVLSRIAGAFGAPTLAALGIVNRLESLNYLSAAAVGMAVSTMVGQNVGARRPDRAAVVADRGATVVTATSAVVSTAFLLFPDAIAAVFTSDPDALREGVVFLRIVAISQPMMCWEIVYGGAFTGTGRTLPPMLVSVLTSLVRVPLASYLAIGRAIGPSGLWWVISLTAVARGVWVSAWFRGGGWRREIGLARPSVMAVAEVVGPQTPEG